MEKHLGRWIVCAALAATLHGAALGMARRTPLATAGTPQVIHLTLRPAGGGVSAGPVAASLPAAAPAPPQVAARRVPELHAAPPRKKAAPRQPSVQAVAAPQPIPIGPPSALAAVPAAVDMPTGDVTTGPSGSGGGAGTGSGGGSGGGSGRGSGLGDGVDPRAFCEYCPEPGYPMVARRRGWKGTVDVQLVLLADGRVGSVSVARSSGYDVLDHEAVEVARRSRFRLPQRESAAPLLGRIEYRFELVP